MSTSNEQSGQAVAKLVELEARIWAAVKTLGAARWYWAIYEEGHPKSAFSNVVVDGIGVITPDELFARAATVAGLIGE